VSEWRNGVRALVLDTNDSVLLVHFSFPPHPWAPPGGGLEDGESDEDGLRRELAEEVGLDEFELGPLLWTREHDFDLPVRFRRPARALLSRPRRAVRGCAAARSHRRRRDRSALVDAGRAAALP